MQTSPRLLGCCVSTHSRLKAAGTACCVILLSYRVSTHSRLKAAGFRFDIVLFKSMVSTHSRLKAAGVSGFPFFIGKRSFNTQPPKGGWNSPLSITKWRLGFNTQPPKGGWSSRCLTCTEVGCFNTQPPKGGWICTVRAAVGWVKFQHTAA